MLAGGLIAYKSKFQVTIALSSTEAEFTAAAEAGKTILYLRSILRELGYEQHSPTTLWEDNAGALFMANAERPTKRTRHMDTKVFVLQDWIMNQHLTMTTVKTDQNIADHFTKALGRVKFYEQTDILMGRHIPKYVRRTSPRILSMTSDKAFTSPYEIPNAESDIQSIIRSLVPSF